MRALIVGETGRRDSVGLSERPVPTAGPGEVVVEVHAAAVNYPDLLMIDGKYQIRPPAPFVLGKDAAGVVAALGDGVTGLSVGDRVLLQSHFGAFAEQVAVPAKDVYRLPAALDFVHAAAFGLVYKTAWLALADRAGLKAGETVLVTGAAGGVGLAAVQTAKALGAARVVAGLTTPTKAAAVLAAGADAVVDLDGDPDLVRKRIAEAARGRGIDVALDVVGGTAFEAALKSLAWKGRLVAAGFTSGVIPSVRANYLLIKNSSVLGFSTNTYDEQAPELVRAAFAALFALAEVGSLKPHLHAVLPVAEFAKAFAEVEQRRVVGKIVLTFR